jgi:hydrogenase maturation factor
MSAAPVSLDPWRGDRGWSRTAGLEQRIRKARVELLEGPVEVRQYALHQLGFVTAVLEEQEAKETLKLFEQVLASLAPEPA